MHRVRPRTSIRTWLIFASRPDGFLILPDLAQPPQGLDGVRRVLTDFRVDQPCSALPSVLMSIGSNQPPCSSQKTTTHPLARAGSNGVYLYAYGQSSPADRMDSSSGQSEPKACRAWTRCAKCLAGYTAEQNCSAFSSVLESDWPPPAAFHNPLQACGLGDPKPPDKPELLAGHVSLKLFP